MSELPQLGPLGIWSRELRYGATEEAVAAARELESAGFGTLWIPDIGGPVLERAAELLDATAEVCVATGILNVWMHEPGEVAAAVADLGRRFPGRFLLGLGIGHKPIVDDGHPGRYTRPLSTMRAYLDALDAAAPGGRRAPRVLAALAPRMIALAAERADGAHPYLVPVAHTRLLRKELGEGALIAQELTVVLETDVEAARARARQDLAPYLGLPNYTRTWLRLGFTEDDLAGGGSDRLLEALYAWGTLEGVGARIEEYRAAGADHVCLRAVTGDGMPLAEWRALAPLAR